MFGESAPSYSFRPDVVDFDGEELSKGRVDALERYTSTPGLRLGTIWCPKISQKLGTSATQCDEDDAVLACRTMNRFHRAVLGQRAVLVLPETITDKFTVALLAGLCDSPSVRTLALFPSKSYGDYYTWYWLLYALFSAGATDAVSCLGLLDADLKIKNVQHLQSYIRSSGKNVEGSAAPLMPVKSQVVYSSVESLEADDDDGVAVPLSCFDVVQVLDDKLRIEYIGQSWIKRQDVLAELPCSSDIQWRLESHSIRSLFINHDSYEQNNEGIKVLLELIGRPLKALSLQLSSPVWFSDESYLTAIWLYCPKLVALDIENLDIESFSTLISAYTDGFCRVASLTLTNWV